MNPTPYLIVNNSVDIFLQKQLLFSNICVNTQVCVYKHIRLFYIRLKISYKGLYKGLKIQYCISLSIDIVIFNSESILFASSTCLL